MLWVDVGLQESSSCIDQSPSPKGLTHTTVELFTICLYYVCMVACHQESYVYAGFAVAVSAVVLVTCDNIYLLPRLLHVRARGLYIHTVHTAGCMQYII